MTKCDTATGPCACGAWHQPQGDGDVDDYATEGRWTTGPPTEPGWYKWRLRKDVPWECVDVMRIGGRLRFWRTGYDNDIAMQHGEWWSVPIQEPPR